VPKFHNTHLSEGHCSLEKCGGSDFFTSEEFISMFCSFVMSLETECCLQKNIARMSEQAATVLNRHKVKPTEAKFNNKTQIQEVNIKIVCWINCL
jgi:hypothetical protein